MLEDVAYSVLTFLLFVSSKAVASDGGIGRLRVRLEYYLLVLDLLQVIHGSRGEFGRWCGVRCLC
jgi:hypothetical protein